MKNKLLFFALSIVFIFYLEARSNATLDSSLVIPTALSILNEGDTALNEYPNLLYNNYAAISINGNFYNYFPIGTSILTIPLLIVCKGFYNDFHILSHSSDFEKLFSSTFSFYFIISRNV